MAKLVIWLNLSILVKLVSLVIFLKLLNPMYLMILVNLLIL